jgi:scyllo-inositol 2-dehydrogenase (NADP+)
MNEHAQHTTYHKSPTAGALGVSLLGHGTAGAWFHGPLVESTPGLDLRVIATSRPESLAGRRPGPRIEPDALAACAAPDVDLVVVATPNALHEPLARAALEAGKHVLVDKPLALSARAVDGLMALARRQGRQLEVFHNRRRDGDFQLLRSLLQAGTLGELRLLELRWDRFRPVVPTGWRHEQQPGAGVLWDLGPHLIDQALALLGTPDDFSADLACQRAGAVATDYFELTLRYGDTRCVVSSSNLVAEPRPRFAAHGSAGSWLGFGVDPQESALKAGGRPDDPDFRASLPRQRSVLVDAAGRRTDMPVEPGDWRSFYVDLAASLRGEGPLPVGATAGRDVVALIESALASAN